MRWTDWLLGQDSPGLRLVRLVSRVSWWMGWLVVLAHVGFLAIVPPALARESEVRTTLDLGSLLLAQLSPATSGLLVPFLGWAVLTALLAVHDLFSADTEDADAHEVVERAPDG